MLSLLLLLDQKNDLDHSARSPSMMGGPRSWTLLRHHGSTMSLPDDLQSLSKLELNSPSLGKHRIVRNDEVVDGEEDEEVEEGEEDSLI